MSVREIKTQLTEYEEIKSQLNNYKKTNLDQFSEEEKRTHLRELGQKTAKLMQLSRTLDELRSLERIRKKQKKADRHKAWKKRHKKRVQKEKIQLQKRNAQWIKDIQWKVTMAPSANALLLKQKQSAAKVESNNTIDATTKANELKEFFECLIELRRLRRKKLESKGHFFADDGNQFFNQVSAMDAANEIAETGGAESPYSSEEEANQNEKTINEQDSWNSLELDKEAYFSWCGADQSLTALLTTRKLWDQYIRTNLDEIEINNDAFRKVPPMFVIPPPPANGVWASYLI